MGKYIEYVPYDKETYRDRRMLAGSIFFTDTDKDFEAWADSLIFMYEYLSGREPEVIDNRYLKMANGKTYDLVDIYNQREKIYDKRAAIVLEEVK